MGRVNDPARVLTEDPLIAGAVVVLIGELAIGMAW
jgi:hypothetical protein